MDPRGDKLCTLTVYRDKIANRILVGFNRDEKRTRQQEIPIRRNRSPKFSVIAPKDVQSGGTWIALNQSGLLFCLLNVNDPSNSRSTNQNTKSRGGIIPLLWHAKSLDKVNELLLGIEANQYPFFRLVVIEKPCCVDETPVRAIEYVNQLNHLPQADPFVLTDKVLVRASSSDHFGDAVATEFRAGLIDQDLQDHWPCRQKGFHFLHLAKQGSLSPLMSRVDAHTTSVSLIDIGCKSATYSYFKADGVSLKELEINFDPKTNF